MSRSSKTKDNDDIKPADPKRLAELEYYQVEEEKLEVITENFFSQLHQPDASLADPNDLTAQPPIALDDFVKQHRQPKKK